ncbi:uncharacterized protein GGS22DRAFT_139527 [Annulohypoxylon maeteangense]|uniref:uncharacterized protein n=1 Tax=Annulohypoxylon maeteangense TaxID=1927788 RepID=UPI0020074341|nr:uncharacterized protein GGS22DRAFT_139527 [Annulohypoxylon maeteangense]KAI0885150.1 hypothetical protein GGS22DRAFT_139527 [Annulohypoxylon maeteangense]
MATTSEPPEESIILFCDVTGLTRGEVITRLKANNNDLPRATEEYFENPSSQKYRWDESQFGMDRQGEANDTGISFNIQGPDELAPTSYQNTAAPTRPPSRANNTSPFGAPTNAAEEDANLERALAESAAESGIPRQEAGIVDSETNYKYFGPANRPQYDTEQWAMVPTKAATDTEKADPTPSQRKRGSDAPAFLRQTKDHKLGFLLSIFHQVPLVRNILLQYGTPARNYGHNSEWWRGQPILKHEHLAAMARGESDWDSEARPEFAEELHRLMAFLDKTERGYGSVDSLVDTKEIEPNPGAWGGSDAEDKLFDILKQEAKSNPSFDMDGMITVGAILPCSSQTGDGSQSEGDGDSSSDEGQEFAFLDTQLDLEQYSWVNTFYDALDHILWLQALNIDHPFPEGACYAVLSKAADVITARFNGSGLSKPCEIPAVFYADRYLKDRKDLALKFQTQMRYIKNKLRMYDLLEANLLRCHGQRCHRVNGLEDGPHDLFACLDGIIKFTERLMQRQTRSAQWRYHHDRIGKNIELSLDDIFDIYTWSGSYVFLPDEEERMKNWKDVIDEANKKIQGLKEDLAKIAKAKKFYSDSLEVISKRLTCQEDEVDDSKFVFRSTSAYNPDYWNPTHKYSLRGVALTSELAYVCVRQGVESVDVDKESKPKDQWWKIGYSPADGTPIKTEKATQEDVLHAAGTESKYPILVYATEAAMTATPTPLPDALRMFIRADNRSFQQELVHEQDQVQPADNHPSSGVRAEDLSQVAVAPSGKRKYSVGSSVATQGSSRADLAEVDPFQWEMQSEVDYANAEEMQKLPGSTVPPKSPEMQERVGGPAPFLTRQTYTTLSDSVEMMDIDTDVEHHEG